MRGIRISLVTAGIVLLSWGAWLLLSRQDLDQLLSVALWLAAVVVVHDGLLAAFSAGKHRLRTRRSAASHEADESSA